MATVPTPVEPEEPTTAPLDDPAQGEPAEPTPAELKAQLREATQAREAAEKLAAELKSRDAFWEKNQEKLLKAVAKSPAPATAPKPPEDDPLEQFDWLGVLTDEKDPAQIARKISAAVKKQVAAELKRGNYISREEAEGYTARIIESATATNRLVSEFPALADAKSEMFAETQRQIGLLGDDPAYSNVPETALYRIAALQAEVVLGRAGKAPKAESDDDRIARVMAAKGLGGGRGNTADTDSSLTADERTIIAKYAAAGFPMTEKEFIAERKRSQVGPRLAAMRNSA